MVSESIGLQDLEHLRQRKAQLAAELLELLQSIQHLQQKVEETKREEERIVHQLHGKNAASMQPTGQQEEQVRPCGQLSVPRTPYTARIMIHDVGLFVYEPLVTRQSDRV